VDAIPGLLDALRSGHLLSLEQLNEVVVGHLQGRFADARALAKELLKRNWLTPYQVNQLMQGRGQELHLGPYLLLERLGEGGAGQVFKARHQKMNRIVALKIIRPELLGDAEVVGRFCREIQVLSRLDCANVVHAYDAGPCGASYFLAMEYVEGTDLARLVKQSGPLPVMQACAYLRQAALGLQHAHERGLVHRDIKPHNLILSLREGRIKVADLGLARLPRAANEEATAALGAAKTGGSLTPAGAVVMGTLDYLAPEQALDFHQADIRADIYSLGCTLWYLLIGAPPFAGGTRRNCSVTRARSRRR
jgi:eukaryotic-like serine/threonine-protein kinase